jgi:hypothetical protein
MPAAVPDTEQLRPLLHANVDRLHGEDLEILHKVAMQLELDRLTGELDAAFDEDRKNGRLADLPQIIFEARSALRQRVRS